MDTPPEIGNGVPIEAQERAQEFGRWMREHPEGLVKMMESGAKEQRKRRRRGKRRDARARIWRAAERVCIVVAALGGMATIIEAIMHLLSA